MIATDLSAGTVIRDKPGVKRGRFVRTGKSALPMFLAPLVLMGLGFLAWKADQKYVEMNASGCLSNLRTLRGYVELYNQDFPATPMKSFDMNLLLGKGYFKTPLVCRGRGLFSVRGEYRFNASMTVGCTIHGDAYTQPFD